MFQGRTTTTVSMPAAGPMDLNEAGRPQWRELLPLFGVALLGIVVAGLGGIILLLSLPRTGDDLGGWNALGIAVGSAFVYGGGSWFMSLRATLVSGVRGYQTRVDDWHYAMLAKYEASDGQIVAQRIDEWAYNPVDLRSHLMAFAAILLEQPRALTIDGLQRDGLWISSDTRQYRVMEFTQDSAAQFLSLLAEAKVITGRSPRQAGQVLVSQPRDQLARLIKLAARDPQVLASMAAQESE
jgi:hypothetical protein